MVSKRVSGGWRCGKQQRWYMTNMISVSTSKNVPHARESALAPSHHAGSIICLCSAVARGDTGGLVFLIEDKFIGSTTTCMMCTSTSQRRVLYHPLAKSCYLVRGALCAIGHNSARSTSLNCCCTSWRVPPCHQIDNKTVALCRGVVVWKNNVFDLLYVPHPHYTLWSRREIYEKEFILVRNGKYVGMSIAERRS